MTDVVLAGGCFWCLDAVYRQFRGVEESVCGYTGGDTPDPDYRSVCSGATGHQEALKLSFDPQVIDLDTVLDIFFTSHDPTSWDRQGADTGSQYRSVLFYADEQQREAFERAVARAQQLYPSPIVTEIKPLGVFYEAEEYHQNYYALNPAQGYCAFVVSPKVAQARRNFCASAPLAGASGSVEVYSVVHPVAVFYCVAATGCLRMRPAICCSSAFWGCYKVRRV